MGENDGMEDYRFSVSGVFRKCLDRQVDDVLRMQQCEIEGGVLLN